MKQIPKLCDFSRVCTCVDCGCIFGTNGKFAKRCYACSVNERVNAVMRSRSSKDETVAVGVGSGGNQSGAKNIAFDENAKWHNAIHERGYSTSEFKAIARRFMGSVCYICGKSDVRIDVHHINGIKTDNRLSNLVPVCVNCHAGVIHAMHRQSNEWVETRTMSLLSDSAKRWLAFAREAEEAGKVCERWLNYYGAIHMVSEGFTEQEMRGFRNGAKQEVLIKAFRNCGCKCACCMADWHDVELVETFLDGNRRNKSAENLTAFCKTCFNAIQGAGLKFADYLPNGEAEVKPRNEAGNREPATRTEGTPEVRQGQSIDGEKI